MRLQSDAVLPTFERLLREQYGLRLERTEKSSAGAGSDTWFLSCAEGEFVLKFPASSEINHPESEPELCAFLRENGIPACDFVKNRAGSCVSVDSSGRVFTLQRHLSGRTLEWNSALETILLESAELLGRIHSVLRNYAQLLCHFLDTKKFRFHSDTPFHLHIVLLFRVGELSGRIPICPSGYAITVTHDGYSVVYK